MWLRLLPLLCLFFLPQISLTQQSGTAKPDAVPETCPVTKASDHPFVPPWPYPAKPRAGGHWFGSDGLWIAPPIDGMFGGFREKMGWWRRAYDWRVDGAPKLKVTGKRLDSPAPPLVADKAEAVGIKAPKACMMVGIDFPTLGCWEITGRYEDDELTFVVWVTK